MKITKNWFKTTLEITPNELKELLYQFDLEFGVWDIFIKWLRRTLN